MFYMMQPDPEQMRQAVDAHQANATANYLELYSALESFTPEQLEQVIFLVGRTLDSAEFGHHMCGVLYGMKRYVHGICGCAPAFGEHKIIDHSDPEFLMNFDKTQQTEEEAVPSEEPSEVFTDEVLAEVVDPKVKITTHRGVEEWLPFSEALERYGLEWYDTPVQGDSRVLRRLRCKKCKVEYQSITDRALEQPGVEGCGGCQQQARWGGQTAWD